MGAAQSAYLTSPLYGQWLQQQLARLDALRGAALAPQLCTPMQYYECLDFEGVAGTGGGSHVLNATLRADAQCATMFSPPVNLPVAVKVCNAAFLGAAACHASHPEIRNTLALSLLYQRRVCDNFVTCLGYGIGCPLLSVQAELDAPVSTWRHAPVIPLLDDDYVEAQREEGHGDTFIVMNRVNGAELPAAGMVFTPRQAFGYVYSLLAAVALLGAIPSDVHPDNLMTHDTGAGVAYTIAGRHYLFPDPVTVVHIDYAAMSDRADLAWGDLAMARFLPAHLAPGIRAALSAPVSPAAKIVLLARVFRDHEVPRDAVPRGTPRLRAPDPDPPTLPVQVA